MSTAMAASVISKQEAEAQLSDMCGDFEEFLRRTSQAQRQMGLAYNYAESNRLAQLAGYKTPDPGVKLIRVPATASPGRGPDGDGWNGRNNPTGADMVIPRPPDSTFPRSASWRCP